MIGALTDLFCPRCTMSMPVVSPRLARVIAERVPADRRKDALRQSVDWLTDKSHGLSVYLGIASSAGREYGKLEREAVITDLSLLEYARCPYRRTDDTCSLGGCMTAEEWSTEAQVAPWGFLPTLLVKNWAPDLLRSLVEHKQIADAKVAQLNWRGQFPPPRYSSNQPYRVTSQTTNKVADHEQSVP